MKTFDEFIAMEATQNTLTSISEHLQGFIQEFEKLKPKEIRERLIIWLENFKDFPNVNYEVLLELLNEIQYYSDDTVDDHFRQALTKYAKSQNPSVELSNFYLCPLGNITESSFRIITNHNENHPPYLFIDINELLRRVQDDEKAIIVFLDDILQSGGQLNSIFKKYLGIKLKDGETKDEYENRVEIETEALKNVFKTRKILLFFYLTFHEGQSKIIKELKDNLGLDIEILVGNDIKLSEKGFFGTSNDITHIEGDSTKTFSDGALKGKHFKDVTQTYRLIKEVGYELLKADRIKKEVDKKPDDKWSESDYLSRALGYGNGSKLFLGQQNVPTSTITALWLPTPDNENKITVQGKEVAWKPLFYRKTKKLGRAERKISEEVFPKISVNKVESDEILTDIYSYDFFTLIALHRGNSISIYGHEQNFIIGLSESLNKLEDEFYKKSKLHSVFPRREWFSFNVDQSNLTTIQEEINMVISTISMQCIGIILIADISILDKNISLLKNLISKIVGSNSSKTISTIIDCPTRNVETLEAIQKSLEQFRSSTIYISNEISLEEITVETNASIFDDKKEFENIVYYLQNVLGRQKFNEAKLNTFESVKSKLKGSTSTELLAFSPKEFIAEFANILIKPDSNNEDWQNFFIELLSVCNTYTPAFIEYLIYYSARSNNEFIRFSSLKFAKDREHLIDYWIEGTTCEKRYFENIPHDILSPISFLLYPMLRFYNRNKSIEGLNQRTLEILNEKLDGKYFDDYLLAEKILSYNSNKYTATLLSNHSISVMKLVESGVDIFEEVGSSILKSQLISDVMMDKIILSTKMTSRKIDMIFKNHQHLLMQ